MWNALRHSVSSLLSSVARLADNSPPDTPKKLKDMHTGSYPLVRNNVANDLFIQEYQKEFNWTALYKLGRRLDIEAEQFEEAWQLVAFCGDKKLVEKYFRENP